MDLSNTILQNNINLNNLITNLENISNLKEYEKLSIKNDILIIDDNSYLQSIYRRLNNDSRINTINHIEKVIKEIFEYLDNINDENNIFKEKIIIEYNKINQYLVRSIAGLQNLKITYFNDICTTKKIDIIIIKIQNRINKINKLLK